MNFLMTLMLGHGSLAHDFHVGQIIPIPKAKNINVTDSNNYRDIAVSSIFGKIIDLNVLESFSQLFSISNQQYGFNQNNTAEMCCLVLSP
jgi:hypothetical protein